MNPRAEQAFVVDVSESVVVDELLLERLMSQLELNHDKALRLLQRIPGVVTKPIPRSEAELIAERFKRLGFRAFVRPETPGLQVGAVPQEVMSSSQDKPVVEQVVDDKGADERTADQAAGYQAEQARVDNKLAGQAEMESAAPGRVVVSEDASSEMLTEQGEPVTVPHDTADMPLVSVSTPDPAITQLPAVADEAETERAQVSVPVQAAEVDATVTVPVLEGERHRAEYVSAGQVRDDDSQDSSAFDSFVRNESNFQEGKPETPIRLPAEFLEAVEREADEVRLRLTDAREKVASEVAKPGRLWQRRLLGFVPALLVLAAMSGYLWQGLKPLASQEQQLPNLVATLLATNGSEDVTSTVQRDLLTLRPVLRRAGVQLALVMDLQGRPLAGWHGDRPDLALTPVTLDLLSALATRAEARGYAAQIGVGLQQVATERAVVDGQPLLLTVQLLPPPSGTLPASSTVLVLGTAEAAGSAAARVWRNAFLAGLLPLLVWIAVSLIVVRGRD